MVGKAAHPCHEEAAEVVKEIEFGHAMVALVGDGRGGASPRHGLPVIELWSGH